MHFCPSCSNLLLVKTGTGQNGETCLVCQTCPYMYPITQQYISRAILERKTVDDVLGGEDTWKNVDSLEVLCPKCQHDRAYFMQIQLRSADEPMTIFFRCCNAECKHNWKEN